MNDNKLFYDMLAYMRLRSGMSARKVSVAAGLSESYVSKVEKGGVVPSIEAFAAIVHTLGLNASEVALLLSLLVKHDDEGIYE